MPFMKPRYLNLSSSSVESNRLFPFQTLHEKEKLLVEAYQDYLQKVLLYFIFLYSLYKGPRKNHRRG